AAADQLAQHVDQPFHGILAIDLFLAVPPKLGFRDACLPEVAGFPEVQFNQACPDVGPPDINGEKRVVPLEHPGRQQVRAADQAGLVGIIADQLEVDVDAVSLEQNRTAPDRQLANPARPETTTNDQT